MDPIIAEYPSRNNKKQAIPSWKQSQLFQPQQNEVDVDYWKTLVDRMLSRRAEQAIPEPKLTSRHKTRTALDSVLSFIKKRRRDDNIFPQRDEPFDFEEVDEPSERLNTTGIGGTCDIATSSFRPPTTIKEVLTKQYDAVNRERSLLDKETGYDHCDVEIEDQVLTLSQEFQEAFRETVTEQQRNASLSLLIRSDSNDSVKDIFEDEPTGSRTITLQSMKSPHPKISNDGHRHLRYQRTYDANVRVGEMISKVQSTPTTNKRPYVKSLMNKPGGIAGRFTEIVKGSAKKRKQVSIARGSTNDLTDDVMRAIEMPKRRNRVIGGTEPEVLFADSTFLLKETTVYPECSQGDIKVDYPRVARAVSPETAKLRKNLGFHVPDVRKSETKRKMNMDSVFI